MKKYITEMTPFARIQKLANELYAEAEKKCAEKEVIDLDENSSKEYIEKIKKVTELLKDLKQFGKEFYPFC